MELYYKFGKYDIAMVCYALIFIFGNFIYPLFNFWHYILASFAYGAYFGNAVFTSYLRYLKEKKGIV